jgi:hypothetical protein
MAGSRAPWLLRFASCTDIARARESGLIATPHWRRAGGHSVRVAVDPGQASYVSRRLKSPRSSVPSATHKAICVRDRKPSLSRTLSR